MLVFDSLLVRISINALAFYKSFGRIKQKLPKQYFEYFLGSAEYIRNTFCNCKSRRKFITTIN